MTSYSKRGQGMQRRVVTWMDQIRVSGAWGISRAGSPTVGGSPLSRRKVSVQAACTQSCAQLCNCVSCSVTWIFAWEQLILKGYPFIEEGSLEWRKKSRRLKNPFNIYLQDCLFTRYCAEHGGFIHNAWSQPSSSVRSSRKDKTWVIPKTSYTKLYPDWLGHNN